MRRRLALGRQLLRGRLCAGEKAVRSHSCCHSSSADIRLSSRMEVPLAAIGGQDVVNVDFESADQRTWIRRGAHHALVENGGGVDLIARPGSGLPGPPVAGRARISDDAIGCGPLAHVDSS